MIGLLVPSSDPRLLGASDAAQSPFVIVFRKAGVPVVDHIINATICVSVMSIGAKPFVGLRRVVLTGTAGMSAVFAGSRTLCALAENGSAPRCFTYIDKSGRPLFATIAVISCGSMAFLTTTSEGTRICTCFRPASIDAPDVRTASRLAAGCRCAHNNHHLGRYSACS